MFVDIIFPTNYLCSDLKLTLPVKRINILTPRLRDANDHAGNVRVTLCRNRFGNFRKICKEM